MSIFIDIKYAFRLLFKSPKFTAMTLAVLIGGLSISLFTFSFLYSTMHKDLDLPHGDSMLSVNAEFNGEFQLWSSYEFFMIKETMRSEMFYIRCERKICIQLLFIKKNVIK